MRRLNLNPKFVCLSVLVLLVAGALAPAATAQDTGRYIVSFNDNAKGRAALGAAGADIVLDLPGRNAAAALIPGHALAGLSRNPSIAFIEEDAIREPFAQVSPWGIAMVQADQVSDAAAGNQTVCIIDSGYNANHEDLGAANGSNDSGSGAWDDDTCSHGSHVAGTISAQNNNVGVIGVAPNGNLNIYVVKVFDGTGCGWSYSSSLVAALDDCVANGASVVSMSLGGSFSNRTEENAFNDAFANGILSIAAAGNAGNTRHSYPASYDGVVSVAAIDSAKVVAAFSQQTDQVELAAPGVAVRSTVRPGTGFDESASVGTDGYEVTAMQDSPNATGSGALFRCNAVDGLGSPGDCAGASGKVCLISRGNISFAEKVQECEAQGGNGAIIFNNAPALFSGTLGGVSTGIPSVGMSGNDGAILEGRVGENASVTTMTGGHYAFYDGTSMATPHVSGVAALVWSHHPTCTAADIRGAMTASAEDLGAAGRDNAYGYGLVQAADAVAYLDANGCGGGTPPGGCTLGQPGDSCTDGADCCSGNCKGKAGSKTCK